MSFNRLNFDMCQYKQTIYESTGPGNYMLGTPPNDCNYCYPEPPTIRLQKAGDSINRKVPLVDTESELRALDRPASKCTAESLYNGEPPKKTTTVKPAPNDCSCSTEESFQNPSTIPSTNSEPGLTHWKDCFPHTVESRHSDPASNLRGTGFDRWEYLCQNPQDNVLIPFDNNVSNRIVVKDNHRPLVPTPVDGKLGLPPDLGDPLCVKTSPVCSNPTK